MNEPLTQLFAAAGNTEGRPNLVVVADADKTEAARILNAPEGSLVPGIPRATVRLQFHKNFTLDDAVKVVDYYAELRVSHIYASPLLTARKGSMHGYDIVDPTRINPELGGEPALRRLVNKLRSRSMGLIVDIVPNHMGVGGSENPWWLHVLEWGPQSRYANWFDIDWHSPDPALTGKILLPFLGKPYAETLQAGELVPKLDPDSGRLYIAYHDHRFPLASTAYAQVLADCPPVLTPVAALFTALQTATLDTEEAHLAACSLLHDIAMTDAGNSAIEALLARFLPSAEYPNAELMHRLLEQQHYRLTWWRNAAEEINWRRFFEVSDLAGVRVENEEVFQATHACIFRLYSEGLIDGIRIDHIDGLAYPAAYCHHLRTTLENLAEQRPVQLPDVAPLIVVEKILAQEESLSPNWEVDGTTGYDFMNQVGALFHDPQGALPLAAMWADMTNDSDDFASHVKAARRQILNENLVGEFTSLSNTLHMMARSDLLTRDIPLAAIRRVLLELLVAFPVYRAYSDAAHRESDAQILAVAQAAASNSVRAADLPLLDILAGWLGGADIAQDSVPSDADPDRKKMLATRRLAIRKFQQLTPPLAAKSVEDTAFYRYGVLLSRNEVGSDPAIFSMGIEAFHNANLARALLTPYTLLATATHDHKRGEDVRARLAVLSEMAAEWITSVQDWKMRHRPLLHELEADSESDSDISETHWVPRAADELMLYQTIVGAWPLELMQVQPDHVALQNFAERIAAWQEKALREAKLHSSWMLPNVAYESASRKFVFDLLDGNKNPLFLDEVRAWVRSITPAATANGLAQTLLRLTSPGIPDLYQGTEFWDFSLVDPDNRRPVDYMARQRSIRNKHEGLDQAWSECPPPQIKQALIQIVLSLRKAHPLLFERGDYLPLDISGAYASHALAFMRSSPEADIEILVVVMRLRARELVDGRAALDWADTQLELPDDSGLPWTDLLSGRASLGENAGQIALADLFGKLPIALLSRSRQI